MRLRALAAALLTGLAVSAQTYLSTDFTNNIPPTFTLDNAREVEPGVYVHIGNSTKVSWLAGQVSDGYGRAALAPTRNADAQPADKWMILPAVHVSDAGAVVRWYARSMYRHFPETYDVLARPSGQTDWILLYRCDGEKPVYTIHTVSLGQYVGNDVDIAFVATTPRGFMLAVDNIFVGVPSEPLWVFDNTSTHYVGADETVAVTGRLANYGASCDNVAVRLDGFGEPQTIEIGSVGVGESVDVNFDVLPELGKRYDYSIVVEAPGSSPSLESATVASDFMVCSHFARRHVIDRASGMWCANCPVMDLTTSRLKRIYGDQLIVPEVHVRDLLACNSYNKPLIDDYVFGIPVLIPDHNTGKLVYSVRATDNFSSNFSDVTICDISATTAIDANGDVRVDATVQFADAIDNAADRYRVAYALLGDAHYDGSASFDQELAASTTSDCYYYMASPVKSDLMFYDNVPVNGEYIYAGVAASLPASISANTTYDHSIGLSLPSWPVCNAYRALVLVIDTETHLVLNAAVADIDTGALAPGIAVDPADAPIRYFDLTGRPVSPDHKGFVIRRCGSHVDKIVNR